MKKKVTLTQSLLWIFISAVLINGLTYGSMKGYQRWKKWRGLDFDVPIKAIVQTGPQKEALKTAYLAELLDLSVDEPVLTSAIDVKKAGQKLMSSPVIRSAEVKIKEPGILYIDYTARQPIAFLEDFKNVALDKEGYPFPAAPFFSPKNLPMIYLGIDEKIRWNEPIKGEKMDLAFDLLRLLAAPIVRDLFNVKRIDVSNAFKESYGRREIVVSTQDEFFAPFGGRVVSFSFPRVLRLSTKKYAGELSNYLKLREELLEKEKGQIDVPEGGEVYVVYPQKTIDFRIPQLAFIEEEK